MSYCHLNLYEREVIQTMRCEGASLQQIASKLGRHRGTISRELKRNSAAGFYGPVTAQKLADQRRKQAKRPWKMQHPRLQRWVISRLERMWSPETMAFILRRDYARQTAMRVSASAIYDWIVRDYHQGGKLWRLLPSQRGRKNRRQRRRRVTGGPGQIAGRVGIGQRPAVVQARQRWGDWEGDTIHSTHRGNGLAATLLTQVERKSRYLLAVTVPDRTADATSQALLKLFRQVPRRLRKTITLDNGKEFSDGPRLEKRLGLQVFYADPGAAWQRGSNEQINGLLRRFFPRKTDFSKVPRQEIRRVVRLINQLPRKCLQYQTPHEVFWQAVFANLA